jgi:hypothetical protein
VPVEYFADTVFMREHSYRALRGRHEQVMQQPSGSVGPAA